ncbi:MAG: accessory regulator [Clostridiales bacterium]|nr:accessory regulator [Clostridiales bacterium]
MLSRISKKIAGWCYAGTPQGDIEITAYGIEILLDTLTKLTALVILAALFGYLREMLIVLIVFSSLRYFAGGFHMHSGIGCFLSMAFIFGVTFAVEKLALFSALVLPPYVLALLLLVAILLVFFYAPFATKNNPITDEVILKRKKLGSFVLSVILSAFIWLVPYEAKIWILIPFLCEVATILPIVNHRTTGEEG